MQTLSPMRMDAASLHEAVDSLDYWRRRRARLPWYRRSARREAAAMVAKWERRVRRGVVRGAGLPAADRIDAGLLVARTQLGRWARRAGVAAVAMVALAASLAGAAFALVVQAL